MGKEGGSKRGREAGRKVRREGRRRARRKGGTVRAGEMTEQELGEAAREGGRMGEARSWGSGGTYSHVMCLELVTGKNSPVRGNC